MRSLLVVWLIAGCSPTRPCSDAPLSGGCEPVEGTWKLTTSASTAACQAGLADQPLVISGRPSLEAELGGVSLSGVLYEGGSFELSAAELELRLDGQYVRDRGVEELRGSVTVGDATAQECASHWQFRATRQ